MVFIILCDYRLKKVIMNTPPSANASVNILSISGNGENVVEADEFARSFHQLDPEVALVTCVEAEHLDYYGGLTEVEEAFVEFLHRLPPEGTAFVGGDDLVGGGVIG